MSAEIKLAKFENGRDVEFKGDPRFNNRVPNMKWFEGEKTWVFGDEDGGIYTFNRDTLQTDYNHVKRIVKDLYD